MAGTWKDSKFQLLCWIFGEADIKIGLEEQEIDRSLCLVKDKWDKPVKAERTHLTLEK